jgi:hypothetical protein
VSRYDIPGHSLQRQYKGQAESREIKPTCSCGWVGIGYAAWNDYQHTMVEDQEKDHIRAACRAPKATGEQR